MTYSETGLRVSFGDRAGGALVANTQNKNERRRWHSSFRDLSCWFSWDSDLAPKLAAPDKRRQPSQRVCGLRGVGGPCRAKHFVCAAIRVRSPRCTLEWPPPR